MVSRRAADHATTENFRLLERLGDRGIARQATGDDQLLDVGPTYTRILAGRLQHRPHLGYQSGKTLRVSSSDRPPSSPAFSYTNRPRAPIQLSVRIAAGSLRSVSARPRGLNWFAFQEKERSHDLLATGYAREYFVMGELLDLTT